MKIPVVPFEQPAGTFMLAVMKATDILKISKVDYRKFDTVSMETSGSVQREPSKKRIRDICDYSETLDAAFPTPILLSVENKSYSFKDNIISIDGEHVADIVDGQHRILGLGKSNQIEKFEIPVVFLLDGTEEQKALIFATINGKQTKVPASLIYDLFGVTENRSPQKTAHEIARALNSTPGSPWYQRLKMLGKKTEGGIESLSQGTFVKRLLPLISDEPEQDMDKLKRGQTLNINEKCVFREYFCKEQDSIILKILMNVFQAVRDTWPKEWNDPDSFILSKTVGFWGIMDALPEMMRRGKERKNLSFEYFTGVFVTTKTTLESLGLTLSSKDFESSATGARKIRDIILKK